MRFLICVLMLVALAACGNPFSRSPSAVGAAMGYAPAAGAPQFGDFNPYPWPARTPRAYPVHGIDVSHWQGDIDWPAVRAAGVSFAYIKATEGKTHADPRFDENWRGAGRAGIARGAYHYYNFCRTADEQARWFIENVPRERGALAHVLDMEWTPTSRKCPYRPAGTKIRAEADRFLDKLERHYGRRPVVYTTVDFYRDTGIGNLRGTQFWLRSVAGHPSQVYPGADWTFWQYTGTGEVAGIEGPVDINAFAGSQSAWRRWRG